MDSERVKRITVLNVPVDVVRSEVNALGGSVKIAGEDGRVLEMPAARFSHSEGKWRVLEEQSAEK